MTATFEFEQNADQAYFQSIESVFLRLRGAPLQLTPADWQVARQWHREGIPLAVVLTSLEAQFERARRREGARPISSLKYCRKAVEKAWKDASALAVAGVRREAEEIATAPRLAALASILPAELPAREELVHELAELAAQAASGADTEALEAALAALDARWMETLAAALDAPARATWLAEVDQAAGHLAARLPAEQVTAARERLAAARLRRHFGFPLLSLFAPEIDAALA